MGLHDTSGEDPGILRDAVQRQQQLLDTQFRALLELHRRAETFVRLVVAVFAGVLALFTLVFQDPASRLDPLFMALVTMGEGLTLVSLTVGLRSYMDANEGISVHIGPDPGWLADRIARPGWSTTAHYRHLTLMYPTAFSNNAHTLGAVSRRLRQSLRFFLLAAFCFGGALAYFLWKPLL